MLLSLTSGYLLYVAVFCLSALEYRFYFSFSRVGPKKLALLAAKSIGILILRTKRYRVQIAFFIRYIIFVLSLRVCWYHQRLLLPCSCYQHNKVHRRFREQSIQFSLSIYTRRVCCFHTLLPPDFRTVRGPEVFPFSPQILAFSVKHEAVALLLLKTPEEIQSMRLVANFP